MAIHWLQVYKTENQFTAVFNLNEQTIHTHVKTYLANIQALASKKIIWDGKEDSDEVFICTVDGTHCCVNKPRKNPSTTWCSHKFKGPAVTYELAIDIYESKL